MIKLSSIKNIFSRIITLNYTRVFLLLAILIGAGLYSIDTRNQKLQQIINKQFTVNYIMKELTDISRYRGEIMPLILDEDDPFNRDDLIQDYNHQTREFLKRREMIELLNLSKIQADIFSDSMKIAGKGYIYQVETINLVNEGGMLKAKKIFAEKILPNKILIRDSYDELIRSMHRQSKIEIDNEQRTSRNAMLIIIALLALLFILAIWIQFIATKAIHRYNMLLINNNEELELTVKERTKELKLARDEADRANKAKSEFLAGMSHELKTPLNGIYGFGQLLQHDKENLNETQNDNINEILTASKHMMLLIDELLDLAQIESGKMKLDINDFLLNDVITQCTKLISPKAARHKVKIINKISNKKHIVQADDLRIKQIILNLLTNAIKYGNDNSHITIDSEVDNGFIRVSVTDTGEGLSKEELGGVFSSYTRLNINKDIKGTGLGLSISKKIIENIGGSIGVESTLGKGSTFWIKIPLSDL